MRIRELLSSGRPSFSFEFFPPKTDKGVEHLRDTVRSLRDLKPTFVSVTYGAGGSTRDRTIELVTRIKRELDLETMAHLTCVGASKSDIKKVLDKLADAGIENVLALRGDPPKGEDAFVKHEVGLEYANEFSDVWFARRIDIARWWLEHYSQPASP